MKRLRVIAGTLAIGGFILTLVGCGSEDTRTEAQAATPVRTAAVTYEEMSVPVHTSGQLSSATETRLSFKVGGIVGSVLADEGESVEPGRLLAQIEPDEINAQVAQARSAYDKAERDLWRVRRLFQDSVATLEQLQDAETGFKVAGSQLEIAEFNQDHAVITAPSAGRILKRFVEANELVGPGTPVFLFGSTGEEWIVRAGVTDRDVIRLRLGDSATVRFDAYPDETFGAEVTEIAEAASPLSGAYEVELSLRPNQVKLVSGFVAGVDIHTSEMLAGHVIPIEALVEADGNSGYVFAPDASGKTVRKIPVKIAGIIGSRVAIKAGLDNVTDVVTDGAAYLTDGSHIQMVDSNGDDIR
jgi:multidrug efflux system membrane fusion protein